VPVGQVKFSLAGKDLWQRRPVAPGLETRSGLIPVCPELLAEVKYFRALSSGRNPRRRAVIDGLSVINHLGSRSPRGGKFCDARQFFIAASRLALLSAVRSGKALCA
jgi:hypothetical protein